MIKMHKNNVLILTPYTNPEKGACVIRVNSLNKYLTKQKLNVKQIAPKRKGTTSNKNIIRYRNLIELIKYIWANKIDILFLTSPPITHCFFASIIAKFKKNFIILDSKDPFSYIAEKRYQKTITNWFKLKIFYLMEIITHKLSNKVIFLNQPNKKRYLLKFRLDNKNVLVIPNGVEIEYYEKNQKLMKENKNFNKDALTMIYSGCLGGKDLENFLSKSAPIFINKLNGQIIILATLDRTKESKKIYKNFRTIINNKHISDKVYFIKNISYLETIKYLNKADIGLISFENYCIDCLPVKAIDYMAANLFLAAKTPLNNKELINIIKKLDNGFYCNNWERFNKKMVKEFKNIKKLKKRAKKGRRFIQTNYLRSSTNEKIYEIIQEHLSKSK